MAAPQRSDDWFRARLGVFTAGSTFKTIMHGYAKGKRSLVLTKAAEVLTGEWQEATAASLEWGKSHEADALAMYEFMYGENVQEEGLVLHPDHARAGCSPDGLVREDGGIEIKCPQTSREHVRNLLEGMDWKEYGPQVQGCM
ncbi:MAG TPA: YqaJ viral recombinase family protein, partial [Gammaproteobacteria bacterium]|nr:YqaJ viral recombinase family protein [Gammaproteobacteria bacterium]